MGRSTHLLNCLCRGAAPLAGCGGEPSSCTGVGPLALNHIAVTSTARPLCLTYVSLEMRKLLSTRRDKGHIHDRQQFSAGNMAAREICPVGVENLIGNVDIMGLSHEAAVKKRCGNAPV